MSFFLEFNDVIIDQAIAGFKAYSVKGRKLAESIVNTTTIGNKNGDIYKSRRFGKRTLVVDYAIAADNETELVRKYEQLQMLLSAEQAKIRFGDDMGVYYIGTLDGMNEPSSIKGAASGKLEFICSEPVKYANAEQTMEYIPQAKSDGTYNCKHKETGELLKDADGNAVVFSNPTYATNYTGTYPASVKVKAQTDKDLGYIALINDRGKVLQFGDVEEEDTRSWIEAETLSFWPISSGTVLSPFAQTSSIPAWSIGTINGTIRVGTVPAVYKGKKLITVGSYGGTATKNHGAAANVNFPANSAGVTGTTHCYIQATLVMKPSEIVTIGHTGSWNETEAGRMYFGIGNASEMLAGVEIRKLYNRTSAKIIVWINHKKQLVKTITAKRFFDNPIDVVIEKSGSKFEVNVGVFAGKSLKVSSLKDTKITRASLYMGREVTKGIDGAYHDTNAVESMGLLDMYYTDTKVDHFEDIRNKFRKGDTVDIDTGKAEILVNGVAAAQLGALGNDWDDFTLQQGMNYITVAVSDWAQEQPQVDITYRKAYL